jgi:hypothetical protein
MKVTATAPVIRILLLTAAAGLPATTQFVKGQALPTAEAAGAYLTVGAMGSISQVDYGQRTVGGVTLYADLNRTWRYGAEIQVQSLQLNQESGTRETTFLAGPRVSFRSRGLIPYVKVLVGQGRFDAPYNYGAGRYLVYAPGAGLDWDLTHRLRLRLINVEYQSWPQFTFGRLHPYGASAGISLRIF